MTYWGKGFACAAGAKKGTTWNSPVACGASNGFAFKSEGITPNAALIMDEQVNGQATQLFGDKGNETHQGQLELDAKYEGLELFIAMAMGTAGVPTQVGSDNAYKHVFQINDHKEGLFASMCFNKVVNVWEYPSVKFDGFDFTCNKGGRATLKFPLIGSSLNLNTSSGTNNLTTVGNLTIPANISYLLFKQMAIRINAASGSALANTDLIYPSDFSISLANNYAKDDVTTELGYLVSEPKQDGFAQISGSLGFSIFTDAAPGGNKTLLDAMLAKTRMKMDVVLTGPIANGATPFSLSMFLPDVQFETGDAPVSGPKRIPVTLKFRANRCLAAPTGMSYTKALTIELVNQRSTDALA
jgi:hypothetical protein